jgi:hypothetical protein
MDVVRSSLKCQVPIGLFVTSVLAGWILYDLRYPLVSSTAVTIIPIEGITFPSIKVFLDNKSVSLRKTELHWQGKVKRKSYRKIVVEFPSGRTERCLVSKWKRPTILAVVVQSNGIVCDGG